MSRMSLIHLLGVMLPGLLFCTFLAVASDEPVNELIEVSKMPPKCWDFHLTCLVESEDVKRALSTHGAISNTLVCIYLSMYSLFHVAQLHLSDAAGFFAQGRHWFVGLTRRKQEALTVFLVSPLGGALPRCYQELVTYKAKHSSGKSLFFRFLSLSAFLPHSLPPPGRHCDVSLNAPLANFCHIYTQTIGVKIEPRPQLTLTHAIQHQVEAHAAFWGW